MVKQSKDDLDDFEDSSETGPDDFETIGEGNDDDFNEDFEGGGGDLGEEPTDEELIQEEVKIVPPETVKIEKGANDVKIAKNPNPKKVIAKTKTAAKRKTATSIKPVETLPVTKPVETPTTTTIVTPKVRRTRVRVPKKQAATTFDFSSFQVVVEREASRQLRPIITKMERVTKKLEEALNILKSQ
jgi:hypothetical protein